MTRTQLLMLAGGGLIAWIYYDSQQPDSLVQSAGETVTALLSGWQNVNDGPTWVPVIHQTEDLLGIPSNLLARQAYEESAFRSDVINGTHVSSAGALGILQLMPNYFETVNRPVPFTRQDTLDQISQAGGEMVRLYHVFGDWGLALAGYNDGQGNVTAYLNGSRALPTETIKYVTQILGDVPVAGATLPA
jgi:soluble lytic murein transglycosylase-like protein